MHVTEQAETVIEDYPTEPTDYLPHIITRCLDKANRHKHRYRFRLGAAVVIVSPDQTYESVNENVQAQWTAARTEPPSDDNPVSEEEKAAPTSG